MATRIEIIERFQAGDNAALEVLFQEESPRLGKFLRRYIRSPEVAEELLQEIWMQAWRCRAQLREPERFMSWFYRIARNAIFQIGRQQERKVQLALFSDLVEDEESGAREEDPPDHAPSPRERAELAQFRRIMEAEVAQLKPPAPEILALRFGAGLCLREISEMLEIPLGSVCSTTSRSLKILKEALNKKGIRFD